MFIKSIVGFWIQEGDKSIKTKNENAGMNPVVRIRIWDPVAFLTLDPGKFFPDPGFWDPGSPTYLLRA
jgi:hypothetical protein